MTPTFMARKIVEKGFTQKEMADALDSRQSTIHRILKGENCNYDLGKRIEVLYFSLYANKKDA
jgi:predicted transcriptional regulator